MSNFKRVPAIDKCFTILELLVRSNEPMGISDISGKLGLNKSTVFNISRTLVDLRVLENQPDGKFVFGTRFYVLSSMAGQRSTLIKSTHRFLEKINERTRLSAFLGIRADNRTILIDKVDSAYPIKVSSEIGLQMPALAGAGIKAMLSQLPDEEIGRILAQSELKRYTPYSITDKEVYQNEVLEVRIQGIAYDREEYIEGMIAFAVPVRSNGRDLQAAIWAVGLKHQMSDSSISDLVVFLKGMAEEINCRLL